MSVEPFKPTILLSSLSASVGNRANVTVDFDTGSSDFIIQDIGKNNAEARNGLTPSSVPQGKNFRAAFGDGSEDTGPVFKDTLVSLVRVSNL